MPKPGALSVVFVIDVGKFEWQSVFLVSSLLHHFPPGLIEISAHVPARAIDNVSRDVLDFHERNGVEVATFRRKRAGFATPYRHGNKILACLTPRPSDWTLFLDTDTMVLRRCDPVAAAGEALLAALPSSFGMWGANRQNRWHDAYRAVGARGEDVLARHGGFPHFNGGVVLYRNGARYGPGGDMPFAEAWLDIAQRLDHAPYVRNKRPWLDQIALGTLAGLMEPEQIAPLDGSWNMSLVRKQARVPFGTNILHYHRNSVHRPDQLLGRRVVERMLRDRAPFDSIEAIATHLAGSIEGHRVPGYSAKRNARQDARRARKAAERRGER
ncbi:hypothetical protein [Pontivivens ytuae]|uniref:Glycosyl transferase family 8 n=1 Tax=Pontivivens ytuae TaxID=2789856 RepID=A0A7S9LS90_9RHOB|nr:hypothetical protein [Pontivivens ytuae]QPH54359.1 hypothetical protein I0K15_00835 [Pontivivens ytuae]